MVLTNKCLSRSFLKILIKIKIKEFVFYDFSGFFHVISHKNSNSLIKVVRTLVNYVK